VQEVAERIGVPSEVPDDVGSAPARETGRSGELFIGEALDDGTGRGLAVAEPAQAVGVRSHA
jgi:hypothetical protein